MSNRRLKIKLAKRLAKGSWVKEIDGYNITVDSVIFFAAVHPSITFLMWKVYPVGRPDLQVALFDKASRIMTRAKKTMNSGAVSFNEQEKERLEMMLK